jgi:hypothetical protein
MLRRVASPALSSMALAVGNGTPATVFAADHKDYPTAHDLGGRRGQAGSARARAQIERGFLAGLGRDRDADPASQRLPCPANAGKCQARRALNCAKSPVNAVEVTT